MIAIDIPQVAYRTWVLEYRMVREDGSRDRIAEHDAEEDLKKALSDYRYSEEHDHVR